MRKEERRVFGSKVAQGWWKKDFKIREERVQQRIKTVLGKKKSKDDEWKDVILLFCDVLAGVCSNSGPGDLRHGTGQTSFLNLQRGSIMFCFLCAISWK